MYLHHPVSLEHLIERASYRDESAAENVETNRINIPKIKKKKKRDQMKIDSQEKMLSTPNCTEPLKDIA